MLHVKHVSKEHEVDPYVVTRLIKRFGKKIIYVFILP